MKKAVTAVLNLSEEASNGAISMTQHSSAESIANEVRDVFENSEHPGDDRIVPDGEKLHLERSQLQDYFRGKPWQNVTLEDLRKNYVGDESACLLFMTPEASKYYLPSYILIVLENYYEADVIIDTLVSILTRKDSEDIAEHDFNNWIANFSSDEKSAIKHFLEWLEQEHKNEFLGNELDNALAAWI